MLRNSTTYRRRPTLGSIGLVLFGTAVPSHDMLGGITSSSGPTLENGSAQSRGYILRIARCPVGPQDRYAPRTPESP